MEPWRRVGIGTALLAMAAWTVYCAFFFLALATPAVEGAAEATALGRLAIVGGWLSGMVVGTIAILGLTRNAFAGPSAPARTRLAAVALVTTSAGVAALYWLELSVLLIFFWAPLTAGVLLLMAWAAGPAMRRRLAVAIGAWLIGFVSVAALWFALPPGTLQFHFWTILGTVTAAVVAWCIWPLLRSAARRPAAVPMAMLIAAASIGCAGPLPKPPSGPPTHQAESPTPSPIAKTPIPSPTAAIATAAPEPSQDAIFRAVGSWIVKNKATELTSTTYLLVKLRNTGGWFLPTEVPELAGALVPPWGDLLAEPSQVALTETLSPIADLLVVDDQQSVVDEAAWGPLNCHPYVEGRAMLRLQRPMVIGTAYFAEANIDQGCQGFALLLRVEADGTQFEVTQVVREGHWVV